ncbi:BMP-binding endothelial regulator protein-like [Ctenocephalides felis]|uniref:BMP-binding endothelial regulator protein-like n=1 Tax=Ctenocephalides felis TaxID=7515 RepID=UPI000E6E1F79|nr:BMP-binding endothelial regulator protein-like [Ctenocephalides felis]
MKEDAGMDLSLLGLRIVRNPLGFFFMTILILLSIICSTSAESRVGIDGSREPCSNEGEIVPVESIKDMNCFKCICKNGFVECQPEYECPPVDNCYMQIVKAKNECCYKCKGCTYEGARYLSDSSWRDKKDPCVSLSCEAGVVTSSRVTCYTPCENPRPPKEGECCPTCDGCVINGQQVTEGRDVTTPEDPCLRCSCSGGRLTCSKKACPVLQCPPRNQIRTPGECCPKCEKARLLMDKQATSCLFNTAYHSHGTSFDADPCSNCTCINGTSICQRVTCPVLECRQEVQVPAMMLGAPGSAGATKLVKFSGMGGGASVLGKVVGGNTGPLAMLHDDGLNSMCCPRCPPAEKVKRSCTFQGKTYKDGDSWKLDACKSCQCRSGEIRCAMERCPKTPMGAIPQNGGATFQGGASAFAICPPGQRLMRRPGQCCHQCVENDGVCTVFGDPHYRTFDGAFFSHRGSCKYLLAADCSNSTSGGLGAFSIRVTNGGTRRLLWRVKRRKENKKPDTRTRRDLVDTILINNSSTDDLILTNRDENFGLERFKRDDVKKQKLGKSSGGAKLDRLNENDSTTKSGQKVRLSHKVSRRDGDAYIMTASAWTRTITLRIGDDLKVNLGRRQRVKVNGKRVELPFFMPDRLSIEKTEGNIKVDTNIGISLLWDGVSFLEVSASTDYKGKLCGLCGNFNSIGRDDLISRGESSIDSQPAQEIDIHKFAESWRVGGKKACSSIPRFPQKPQQGKKTSVNKQKKNKQQGNGKNKSKQDLSNDYFWYQDFKCDKRMRKQANLQCRLLKDSELFGGCDSRLNPQNFISACTQDVCECQARLDSHTLELSRVTRSHLDNPSSDDNFSISDEEISTPTSPFTINQGTSDRTILTESILKNSFKLLTDDSSTVRTVNRRLFTNDDDIVTKRVTTHGGIFTSGDILRDFMRSEEEQ